MLGFIIGILCLFGLRWAIRRSCYAGACHGYRGHGHGHWHRGHARWHHHDMDDERDIGVGPRGLRHAMRWLFWRLDTSPGQEKAIRAEVEQLVERLWSARRSLHESRGAVAQAMRGDTFDEAPLAQAFAGYEVTLGDLRAAITSTLARIHEALDPRQREVLAELLERRFGGFRGTAHGPHGGPYRG